MKEKATELKRISDRLREINDAIKELDRKEHWGWQDQALVNAIAGEKGKLQTEAKALYEREVGIISGSIDPTKEAAPAAPAPRPAARWPVRILPEPVFPADFHSQPKDVLGKAFAAFIDFHENKALAAAQEAGLDPARGITQKMFFRQVGLTNGVMAWVAARLRQTERRLAEMEASGVRYRGVWQRSDDYKRGDIVTESGSCWHAVRHVSAGDKPGSSDCWQLMVKRGSDGKDAR